MIKIVIFISVLISSSLGDDIDFDGLFSESKNSVDSQVLDTQKVSKKEMQEVKSQVDSTTFKPSFIGAIGKSMVANGNGKSSCFSVKNDDKRYQCLAQTKHNSSGCFSIKNKSRRSMCLAITKGNKNSCFAIRYKNMQYSCLAQVNHDKSGCYSVQDKDEMYECLAHTSHDKNMCFSIRNEDSMYACLAELDGNH